MFSYFILFNLFTFHYKGKPPTQEMHNVLRVEYLYLLC